MMEPELETWPVGYEATARIVGTTENKLRNLQRRNGLLPRHRPGTGRTTTFRLSEILAIAVAIKLIDNGIDPNFSCKYANSLVFMGLWTRGENAKIGLRQGSPIFSYDPDRDLFISIPISNIGLEVEEGIISEIRHHSGSAAAEDARNRFERAFRAARKRAIDAERDN